MRRVIRAASSRLLLPRPLLRFFSRFARPLVLALGLMLLPVEAWHEWMNRQHRLAEARLAADSLAGAALRAVEAEVSVLEARMQASVRGAAPEGLRPGAGIPAPGTALPAGPAGGNGLTLRSLAVAAPEEGAGQLRIDPAIPAAAGAPGNLVVSVPLRDSQGAVVATLRGELEAGGFRRMAEEFRIGRPGSVMLLGAGGSPLAGSGEGGRAAGARGRPESGWVGRLGLGPLGLGPLPGEEARIVATRRSTRLPLAVEVSLDAEEALESWSWHALLRMILAVVLASLIVVLGDRLIRSSRYRRRAEHDLAEREAQFRMLAEHASDMVSHVNAARRIEYASPAAERLTGRPAAALLGLPLEELARLEDRGLLAAALDEADRDAIPAGAVCRADRPDGGVAWIETVVQRVREQGATGYVAVTRDVTERQLMQGRILELAATDGLTGIANRRRFDELLDLEWRRAAREATSLAVILLDVDRFKLFNDRYGHLAGDDALRGVARALEATIRRPADVAARYGGEEFAILLPNTDETGGAEVAERIREAIAAAGIMHEANESGVVTASLGVAALVPRAGATMEPRHLLAAADAALYEAKRTGRDRVVQAPTIRLLPGKERRAAG